MCKLLGTELHPTTAYHPQANGLVERFHRDMKASLKARLIGPHWMDELPWVLLGIRTAPKEDLKASSAELVFGSPLSVPGDFVPDSTPTPVSQHLQQLRERVGNLRPVATGAHGEKHIKTRVTDTLRNAKFVFVRHDAKWSPLQTPYDGPYEVLQRQDKYFTLKIGNRQDSVSIDRLKPAHMNPTEPAQVAVPPRKGRPRSSRKLPRVSKPQPEVHPSTQIDRPTYAEVTTRSGRSTKLPVRFQH